MGKAGIVFAAMLGVLTLGAWWATSTGLWLSRAGEMNKKLSVRDQSSRSRGFRPIFFSSGGYRGGK